MSSLSKVASIKCATLELHPCSFPSSSTFHRHCPLPSQVGDGIINVAGDCGHFPSVPPVRHKFKWNSLTGLFHFFHMPISIIAGFLTHEHLLAGHLSVISNIQIIQSMISRFPPFQRMIRQSLICAPFRENLSLQSDAFLTVVPLLAPPSVN